jgi:hypothetical protein
MKFIRTLALILIFFVAAAVLASQAARFLVVDEPARADAIVVLAGETYFRPMHAVDLMHQGYASRVFIDAEDHSRIFDESLVDIANRYVNGLGESGRVSVCSIRGNSTFSETEDVLLCLQSVGARSALIVTSEFHTRRALMIFKHRLPQYEIHIAAARNSLEFGGRWWTNREWAKTTVDEWLKLIWWQAVDRWR